MEKRNKEMTKNKEMTMNPRNVLTVRAVNRGCAKLHVKKLGRVDTKALVLVVVSTFIDVALNGMSNAQPATLGPNNFTGTQSVNVQTGNAIVAVTGDASGKAVHGIGGIGGQFETGTGFILL